MRGVGMTAITVLVGAQLGAVAPLAAQTGADTRNLPPPGSSGGSQAFAGTLRCATYNGRPNSCYVDTQGRVVLLQREAGICRQGDDWGYDNRRIWVDDRCVAVFGYGYAPQRPQPPVNPGWQDRNFAGTLECTARSFAQQRCYVATEDRVELLQQTSGRCVAGQNWGYTRDFIWVSNRCAATFGYGNAYRPQPQRPGGPSAGAIIGGVAVAAGLIALLSRGNKTPTSQTPTTKPVHPPQPPAAISADLTTVQAAARPTVQNCLFEAARQVGATGGSRLRFDGATRLDPGNGGWRLTAVATSTYPDGERATPFFCRATPIQVVELTFTG